MNFYEKMKEVLINHGMFENQAEEVLKGFMEKEELMQGRWGDRVDGYPENMVAILWMSLKNYASDWIKENCPQAWFSPMFHLSTQELQEKVKEKNNFK